MTIGLRQCNPKLHMQTSAGRVVLRALFVLSLGILIESSSLRAQRPASIPEEIEWTWEVRPQHADPKLPNVLLLGDSITRNYFPQVTQDLRGVANVYLMASSTSVGDPRLSRQIAEFAATQRVSFAVIHFNNGMHGWGYTEAQFQSGFPMFLRAIRSLPGRAKLIWATITPVKGDASGGATNPRIDARNAVAHAFIEAEKILVDDQHGLMIRHLDLYDDSVHFNESGSAIMGGQAATIIKQALETSGHE
jgi:lysophospholipase L1-like esterase